MKSQDLPQRRVYGAWASGPLAVALGAGAHLLAGEAVPGPWILLALMAFLSMGASMLTRLRLPVWMLLLVSGLVQQGLHLMFAGLSGDIGGPSVGHTHGVPAWQQPQLAHAPDGHSAVELMLDAHVAAALLTVFVIAGSSLLASSLARRRSPGQSRFRGVG